MKRTLSMITLAAFATMLLGSCAKINERLDDLEKKVDGLENEKIATIDSQVRSIESSISDLESLRDKVQAMSDPATGLGKRIEELEAFASDVKKNFATKDWAEATFATMEEYEKTCGTVAKIAAKVEGFDSDIKACADSLKRWVNEKFGGYYDIATIDAKLAELQEQVDGVDSLSAELAKTREEIDTAKAAIRAEYRAVIETAIKTSEGKLTQALQDSIASVNATIGPLTGRVDILETAVAALTGKVDSLENMIQTVAIVPAYSNGSVKVDKDSALYIDCIITPAEAVKTLDTADFTILLNKVQTKAVTLDTVPTDSIKVFTKDTLNGTVSIKAYINETLAELGDDYSLAVAVNVKKDKSDYTTEFVKVALPVSVSIDKQSIVVPSPESNEDTTLVATVKNSTKGVFWTSSNESIATVGEDDGTVTIKAGAIGKDTIVVKTIEGNATDTCFVFVGCVEIGGLTWAMCNVGATTVAGSLETCAGYYFSWGNTVGYVHKISKWVEGSDGTTQLGSNGKFDKTNYLSTPGNTLMTDISPAGGYDAARANLGDGWRMPTAAEFKALADACGGSSSYDTSKNPGKDTEVTKGIYWCNNYDGVKGHLFCDGTNKLFFPAAGRGDGTSLIDANANGGYWSSTFDSRNTNCAYYSYFTSSKVHPRNSYPRSFGFPVRPVSD